MNYAWARFTLFGNIIIGAGFLIWYDESRIAFLSALELRVRKEITNTRRQKGRNEWADIDGTGITEGQSDWLGFRILY